MHGNVRVVAIYFVLMKESQFVRFSKCLYLCTLSVESVEIEKLDLCAYESPCFVLQG